MASAAQIKKLEVPNNQPSSVSLAGIASVNVTVRDEVPTPQLSVGAMCNGMHCGYTIIVAAVINTDAALGSDLLFLFLTKSTLSVHSFLFPFPAVPDPTPINQEETS